MGVVTPATGEHIADEPLSSDQDVDRAVTAAARAFETFGSTTPAERATMLLKLADALDERAEEFVQTEVMNAGKPIEAFREDEIPVASDCLRFFAGAARTMQGPTAGECLEGYTSMSRREPVGVIGQVTPWN